VFRAHVCFPTLLIFLSFLLLLFLFSVFFFFAVVLSLFASHPRGAGFVKRRTQLRRHVICLCGRRVVWQALLFRLSQSNTPLSVWEGGGVVVLRFSFPLLLVFRARGCNFVFTCLPFARFGHRLVLCCGAILAVAAFPVFFFLSLFPRCSRECAEVSPPPPTLLPLQPSSLVLSTLH
jgi:hypothetical protein